MNSSDVLYNLNTIAALSSRTDKEAALDAFIKDDLMKKVLQMMCDPFITFGITPPVLKGIGIINFDLECSWLWSLLDALRTRTLTGNEARDMVSRAMVRLNPDSCELLFRILSKDPRAGFTKNTINRVMPGTIPVFEVMLSKKYEEKRVKSFPVGVEPKLDGLRALGLCKDGVTRFYSRVGNHFPSLDHLSNQVAEMVEAALEVAANRLKADSNDRLAHVFSKLLLGGKVAIDCEAITGSFNKSVGDVKRVGAAVDVTLNIFDAVPYLMMIGDSSEIKIPFKLRRKFTEFLVSCKPEDAPFVITPITYANSHEEIMSLYADYQNQGLEGAMVKILDAPYVKKKGFHWMKIKSEETEDLIIFDAFEGEGKYAGKLGGFLVNFNGVTVSVGGGFSDEQREQYWSDYTDDLCDGDDDVTPTKILGRMIEVKYHEITPDLSLRHPRFIKFRSDKDEGLRAE